MDMLRSLTPPWRFRIHFITKMKKLMRELCVMCFATALAVELPFDILPSSRVPAYRNASMVSWGGSVVLGDDGYHAFLSAMANGGGLGAQPLSSLFRPF